MKKTTIIRTWFPSSTELFCDIDSKKLELTPSAYLHSLWVGFSAPIINMPELVWRLIITKFVDGVCTITIFVLISWFNALLGKAIGVRHVEFEDNQE
ncbi:hypothetical protein [Ferrovum sp.]|uniref:hypothetical protein n=1 Tax=Ferrovum sp. TaxID=2609467 RepID=UPI00262087B5|nr:hypothetical protein [Ferrovum sp.]